MIARSCEIDTLKTHINHLRFAVATTTCERTAGLLRQMLRQCETQLHEREFGWDADQPRTVRRS